MDRPRYNLETLLEVVAREFLERGYDATSMDHLARSAGLTKSSLYHHVRSKEQLLSLCIDRALDALFALLEEPGAVEGAAVDRLVHVVRRTTEVLVDELPYVTVLLRVRGNTETERRALERRRDFDRRVTQILREAIADGSVRDDLDPRFVVRLLFGTINSLVDWWRPGRTPSRDSLVDSTTALLRSALAR